MIEFRDFTDKLGTEHPLAPGRSSYLTMPSGPTAKAAICFRGDDVSVPEC